MKLFTERRRKLSKAQFVIIQVHAVMIILGFMFMHGALGIFFGDTDRAVSFAYRIVQIGLSLYVLLLCRKSIVVTWKEPFLAFLSLVIVLYSLRMFYDMAAGPFVMAIPQSWFWENILSLVFSLFISVLAMIASRRYLEVNFLATLVFWGGMITLIGIIMSVMRYGISIQDERLTFGRAFGTLQTVQMCAFVILSGVHLIINDPHRRVCYLIGIIALIVIALATGARGGFIGLIVALGVYVVMALRRSRLPFLMAILVLIIIYVNIISIVNWIGEYFPIFSERMLATIEEKSTGGRDPLYELSGKLISENPILGFSYRLNADETGYTTHNGILDIMLALGIPMGLVFVFFFYIKSIIMAIRRMTDKRLMFATSMVIFSLTASMSGSALTNPVFCFSMCLIGAVYYYYPTLDTSKNKKTIY